MSKREIDPTLRFAEVFVDELHWIKLTEIAAEKQTSVDKVWGAILEHSLVKLGKIKYEDHSDSIIKCEVTLEPVREDKQFFDALLVEREQRERDQYIASHIDEEEEADFDWGGV